MSRLRARIEALDQRRRRQQESYAPLKLLTTGDLALALMLVERGGVLPSGEVRDPEVYRWASQEELEALERWTRLCGEPLDHLDAAEELLDRMGDACGWCSREALDAARLRQRLEQPQASPWFVEKSAVAVVAFYAELEEHGGRSRHPAIRGAVRRLERLQEMEYVRPAHDVASPESTWSYPGQPGGEPSRPAGGGAPEVEGGPVDTARFMEEVAGERAF